MPCCDLKGLWRAYKGIQGLQSLNPKTKLLLSWIGQHNPVTSSTIARWLKSIMSVDISIFKSHSVQGATCSWGRCYWRQQIGPPRAPSNSFIKGNWMVMTKLVLVQQFCHPRVLQTIHVDMKRSLPKCNLWMAQGTKCLHAIWTYMRKVKLKYHVSTPPCDKCTYQPNIWTVSKLLWLFFSWWMYVLAEYENICKFSTLIVHVNICECNTCTGGIASVGSPQ